jgi:hypothetical protein
MPVVAESFGRAGALPQVERNMSPIRFLRIITTAALAGLLFGANAIASAPDEPEYLGKSLSHWIKVIHDRDEESISLAFDAIAALGPQAQAAVPDLISIVSAPFSPIRTGKDSRKVIASKLYDIEVRAGAIDALASIGEPAASAAGPLIQWALAPRVIPETLADADDEELFIELVMMDTEQRMRVAGAISQFGAGASSVIARSLSSSNNEKRKLAVAILNEGALAIASELLRSKHCEDRDLGLLILQDMDLVVAKPDIDWLRQHVVCSEN